MRAATSGPGSCAGGVQRVLKPVAAVAGDVVVSDGVAVNGHRSRGVCPRDVDSAGRALPHPARGRYLVAPGELWLVSRRVANSWDSRYLGPDLGVAGPRGGAAGMDRRVMRGAVGAATPEGRR